MFIFILTVNSFIEHAQIIVDAAGTVERGAGGVGPAEAAA